MNSLAFRSTIRFTAMGVALLLAGSLALAAGPGGDDEPDAWLGVFLGARAGEPGILIHQVIDDSPAEAAGMQDKDVIIAFNGVKIDRANDFYSEMGSLRPGDTVPFTVLRDGDEVDLSVTLAERQDQKFNFNFAFPDIKAFAPQFSAEMRERGYLGIGTQQITDDLREYFGVAEGEGILVNKVVEDSPAAQGGLRAGDVIVEADGEVLEGSSDLIKVLQEKGEGDPIQLTVYRDGKSRSMEVICGVTKHRVMDWRGVNPCGDHDEDCDFHFDFDWDGDVENFLGPGYLEGMERLQEYLESEEFQDQMEMYYEKSLQYQDQMDGWREQLEEKLQELEEKLREMQDKKRTSARPAPPPRAALLPSHI